MIPVARENSRRMKGDLPVTATTAQAHAAFRKHVMDPEFSCLGAKAACNEKAYVFGVYQTMGTRASTLGLARDLHRFIGSEMIANKEFSSFIALFRKPIELTEREFEQLLWLQLRQLHAADRCDWDPHVSSDPSDPHFSFSFAGQAFYVVGMHAHSSRAARRFPWPTLVFNPHVQFERLRTDGKWKRMQQSIRVREVALQGSINPMLNDFGERSEARQYSGRTVAEDWSPPFPKAKKCPFGHCKL